MAIALSGRIEAEHRPRLQYGFYDINWPRHDVLAMMTVSFSLCKGGGGFRVSQGDAARGGWELDLVKDGMEKRRGSTARETVQLVQL